MKIAIYGVSRSGKNYLIERLLQYINRYSKKNAFHLEGSVTLNEMAQNQYGEAFKYLSEEKKEGLRKDFTKLIYKLESEYDTVIVDGHYAFIGNNGYKIVFTEDDRSAYDVFLYLDTPSDMIVTFSRNSSGSKKNTWITEQDISKWKAFEIKELKSVCASLEKDLIILDEDTQTCIEFIDQYVADKSGALFNPAKVAKQIVHKISDKINCDSNVILLDCDKTISENDATRTFCKSLEIDFNELKTIFFNDRYSIYQFYKVAKIYGSKTMPEINSAAQNAKSELKINDGILQALDSQRNSLKIGITSGVYPIWKMILDEKEILDGLIGCFDLENLTFLITPQVKAEVVKQLQATGKKVSAIGDSVIDIPMLEAADYGFIIAHEKLSNGVVQYFKNNSNTKIKQLPYSNHKYPEIHIEGKFI